MATTTNEKEEEKFLHISASADETKDKKKDKKDKKEAVGTPQTSAMDQWSYYENDIETVEASDGRTFTFRKANKTQRKIYFSMKIKRFSDIDNVRESFRSRFHLYLNWMITKEEYDEYLSYKKVADEKIKKMKWEPKFKPRIEFVNNVEEKHFEAVNYGLDGEYRVQVFTKWLSEADCGFDCNKTLFVRQKLECDYIFSEQLELRTFPFDCQDFTIVIRESNGIKKAVLYPEPRYTTKTREAKSSFFKLDPTFSVLDEWDFYSTMLEISDSSSGASRSKSVYAEVTVRFKMKRRWKVYVYNIVMYFSIITFLSLTCFALDANDIGERLNLAVTILLTLVAFQHTVFSKLPNIPYLTFLHKYIIISFIFVCIVILESSFVPIASKDTTQEIINLDTNKTDYIHKYTGYAFDVAMSWLFALFWFAYHIFFILRSGWIRYIQSKKLTMDSDEISQKIDEKYPQFLMSWKSLLDFRKAGDYQKWQQQESILEVQRQESEKEIPKNNNKKSKKNAHCVMSFGGKRGEILTFTSYAQKDVYKEFTFCGLIGHAINNCCQCIANVICCECCRGQNDTNQSIKKTKSNAYDRR